MNSFKRENVELPLSAVWLTNSIAEYKGKQELYAKQSPQILKTLLETALIESAESSNRIEGVTVDHARLKPLIIGHSKPRDRSEEEVVGYRKALELIHTKHKSLRITPETIKNYTGFAVVNRGMPVNGRRKITTSFANTLMAALKLFLNQSVPLRRRK